MTTTTTITMQKHAIAEQKLPEPIIREVVNQRNRGLAPSSDRSHKLALTAVTIVAFLTRFCGISYPSSVVFDEAHILRFLSSYLANEYFFDLHPPLGRLIFLAFSKLLGWKGGYFPDDCGDPFEGKGIPYITLRAVSATFSTVTIPLVYLTLQEAGCGVPACLVAAGLLALDTAHIAHTRLIYLDGFVCFFILLSFYGYLRFTRQQAWSKSWWQSLSLTGLGLCCIMSTKMVGVFTYAVVGLYTLFELWALFDVRSGRAVKITNLFKHILARLVAYIVVPFFVYLFCFWIHLTVLWKSGPGDDYMDDRFVLTLKGNIFSGQRVLPWSFLPKWYDLQKVMLSLNGELGIGEFHPYEVRPPQWMFPTHGVLYWCSDATREQVFFTGNIPGWWLASASILLVPILVVADYLCQARGIVLLTHRKRRHLYQVSGFFFVAWVAHYAPFFTMIRQLMLHSYLPAFMLSAIVLGSLIELLESSPIKEPVSHSTVEKSISVVQEDRSEGRESSSSVGAWLACWTILILVFLFWWFWFPLTYGQPTLSPAAVQRREILNILLDFGPTYNQTTCRKENH